MVKDSRGSLGRSVFRALATGVLCMLAVNTHAAVGRTAGSFEVTAVGSAQYSLPLFVPPGPRGLQPNLALVYNSSVGASYVGKGWTVQGTGFSSIRRCARNLAQDGTAAPIQLILTDGYCLDGNRLRLQSGSYGQSGSVWATEIADFSRITAYGTAGNGPAYWVVERQDGLTYTYGNTADSQVLATGTTTANQWMVNEIRDRHLNKILFTWKTANPTTSGTTHPVKIQWTQTAHNSGSYVYSMDFTYSAGGQSGGYFGYLAGTQVFETDLLTAITVSTSGVVSRHYALTHDTSPTSGARRLTRVKECADIAASDCLAPTDISYQDGQTGVNLATPALSVSGNVTAAEGRYDFDGNGIRDVAYMLAGTWRVRMGSHANGYGPEINTGLSGEFRAGKLRNTSSDGILMPSGGTWYAYVWNGSSFAGTSTGITTAASSTDLLLMDADGDGRDDLVYVTGTSVAPFWAVPNVMFPVLHREVRRNTSTGGTVSFASPVASQIQVYITQALPPEMPPPPMQILVTSWTLSKGGDLDGDKYQEARVRLSYVVCYYMPTPWCGNAGQYPIILEFGISYATMALNGVLVDAVGLPIDINGDDCQDLMLSSGAALSSCTTTVGATLGSWGLGLADWSGDGRADSISAGASTLFVRPFLGSGFGVSQDTGIPGNSSCKLVVTDGNGDGLDDFGCLIPGSSLTLYYHNGTNTPQDLAAHFVDGFGVTHSPSYGSITGNVYTPYSNAVHPNRDVLGDRVVVGSVAASDGIGGTFTTTYTYFGGVENLYGRGFLGFDKIEAEDGRSGIAHVRNFRRDWPYSGALSGETWLQGGGFPLRSRTYTRSSQPLDTTPYNERHFVYLSITDESIYEPGAFSYNYVTRKQTQFAYDPAHGNPTTVTQYSAATGWTNVQTTTTAYTYSNPAALCYLPASMTVTHAAPGEPNIVQYKTLAPDPDSAKCRIGSEIVEPGNTARRVDTSYGYDAFGNVSSVSTTGYQGGTPMTARTSTTGWGATGQFPVSQTNALGQTTTRTFHATFGSLLTETDANSIQVANNQYDSFGRLSLSTRPDGTSTLVSYAACDVSNNCWPTPGGIARTLVTTTQRDTTTVTIRQDLLVLDQFDRQVAQVAQIPDGSFSYTVREYNDEGQVSRESVPLDAAQLGASMGTDAPWVVNAYDLLGRPTSQSRKRSWGSAETVATTVAYAGLTQTTTDAEGKQSSRTMDVQGRLSLSSDQSGALQGFYYDAAGSLRQVNSMYEGTLFTATYSYGIQAFQDSTTDADLGTRSYTYNSLGELLSTTDARNQTATFQYDALSRLTERNEPDGSACFQWGTSLAQKNIGALQASWLGPCSQGSGYAYKEAYGYDGFGRLSTRDITADQLYSIGYSYNNQGGLDVLTYPGSPGSPLQVRHNYQYGMLTSVANHNSPGTVYWSATGQNARGQVTQESLGNGIVTSRGFDAVTGLLDHIHSGAGPTPSTTLQNHSYAYDKVGNLTQRLDGNTAGLTENFYYDNVHRLDYSTLGGVTNLDVGYAPNGNIMSRSDVNGGAAWSYDATRKHAVTGVGAGSAYVYDANGNMTTRGGPQPATIGWTSYNYPTSVTTGSETVTFAYGPDRQYYRQVYSGPSGTQTTHYIGGLLEKVEVGASTDWRHYIQVGGQTVAILSRISGVDTVRYPLEDHQGSAAVLTSSSGTSIVKESFGAFGLPRDGNDWDGAVPAGDQALIEGISGRGYTGHTMLASLGLIHMNGRMYDARIGRFLSPDPYVPHPGLTQSFNRYSYVRNNPLTLVDPSGFMDAYMEAMCLKGHNPWASSEQQAASFADQCFRAMGFIEALDNGWLEAMGRYRQERAGCPSPVVDCESYFRQQIETGRRNRQASRVGTVTLGPIEDDSQSQSNAAAALLLRTPAGRVVAAAGAVAGVSVALTLVSPTRQRLFDASDYVRKTAIGPAASTNAAESAEPRQCAAIERGCKSGCTDIFVDDPNGLPGSGSNLQGRWRRCVRECMAAQGCDGF